MASRQTLFPRWSNLSPTMKGIGAFGLCFLTLVIVSWILNVFSGTESEAVSILSVDRPDDAAFMAMPIAVGTVLITDGTGQDLPGTWMRCEGQALRTEDHPALAEALGLAIDASSPSQFKLPDYRGLSVLKHAENTGMLRWFGSVRRTYGNLRMKGAALTPITGMTMSDLSFIIRVT